MGVLLRLHAANQGKVPKRVLHLSAIWLLLIMAAT